MKQKLRSDQIRAMVGAVLSSRSSTSQLRDFAQTLRNDPSFAEEFADRLDSSLDAFEERSAKKYLKNPGARKTAPEQNIESIVQSILRRKKINRSELVGIIEDITKKKIDVNAKWPTLKIIKSFLNGASATEYSEFVSRFDIGEQIGDPYMLGISRRKTGI